MGHRSLFTAFAPWLCAAFCGCLSETGSRTDPDAAVVAPGTGGDDGTGTGGVDGTGGDRGTGGEPAIDAGTGDGGPQPLPSLCTSTTVDRVDLLFVVDDSISMFPAQAALRAQFPRLLQTLASGELLARDGSVLQRFAAVVDLHLGVVSTDMGLIGVDGVPSCENGFGGDGKLLSAPSPDVAGCDSAYPTFLSYRSGDDPALIARDLGCIATLGTGGCGFEQPLEAALKALWPEIDIDPATGERWINPANGQPYSRVTFVTDDQGAGRFGHGDGANAGFQRGGSGASLLGVVVVTDEEDCSTTRPADLTPPALLPDGHPLKLMPMNLRCFYNKDNLFDVDRYINGLKALRAGTEELVVFAAIAGVPVDLTQLREFSGAPLLDFEDPDQRNLWYGAIVTDERMVEKVDNTEPEVAKRFLTPSCITDAGKAFPPRRLLEVAMGFGANGIVQSICQDDLSDAMDGVMGRIVHALGSACQ